MHANLQVKVNAMLWDIPSKNRDEITKNILHNAFEVFYNNEHLLINALGSLKWYDLIKLLGQKNLLYLLTDSTIQKLYPEQRRKYYKNARRLLSKYTISTSGKST